MRFLHVSDLHIGKRVNGMSMVADQEYILAQIVQILHEHAAEVLVIAGDIYDKTSPSAEAVAVFDSFLTDVAQLGIRVVGVPGNHDSAERIAYAQRLLAKQGVCFPPVYAGTVERVVLSDEHGDVTFWLMPFLKPGDVRRFFPEVEVGDDYAAAIRAVLGTCGVDAARRNVVVSHQLVTAGGLGPERAADEIQLGGIDNVDVSVYADFDYVALGHVHRPQRIGRDTARYSGSPLKYSFGEARYDKSAVLVELGFKGSGDAVGECVSLELIPLVPLHDVRELRMPLEEVLALGEANPSEDYLHVTLTDEHPQLDAMRKVHEVFPNAMALDYDNAVLLAAHEQVRRAIDPDEVDAAELFSEFYQEQVGKPLDNVQRDIVESIAREVESAHATGADKEGDA